MDHYLLGVFTKLKRAIREHSHRSHHSGLVGPLLSAESSADSSFVTVREAYFWYANIDKRKIWRAERNGNETIVKVTSKSCSLNCFVIGVHFMCEGLLE